MGASILQLVAWCITDLQIAGSNPNNTCLRGMFHLIISFPLEDLATVMSRA